MSVFSGQFGSFGGGYMTGKDGRSLAPSMQFGGGYLQAPQPLPTGPVTEEVRGSVEVVYALDDNDKRPRDRSGRRKRYERKGGWWPFDFPVEPRPENFERGGIHRQKRY